MKEEENVFRTLRKRRILMFDQCLTRMTERVGEILKWVKPVTGGCVGRKKKDEKNIGKVELPDVVIGIMSQEMILYYSMSLPRIIVHLILSNILPMNIYSYIAIAKLHSWSDSN